MIKRLLQLNGLAILAVVLNHAVQWGYTAMFWWTDRYRPVTVPNYDQLYTAPYYALTIMEKLTNFAVPSFLFISGVFIAYAARRSTERDIDGAALKKRLTGLLIPYLLWSVMIFFGEALQGRVYPPFEYVQKLLLGRVIGPYFYVPLLCQFFLLAPLMVSPAREHWRALLLTTAGLQLLFVGFTYAGLVGKLLGDPNVADFRTQIPTAFFGHLIFFFSLGVVSGFHLRQLQRWLSTHQRLLIVLTILSAAMALAESSLSFRYAEMNFRSQVQSIPSALYAVGLMLLFLSHDVFTPRQSKWLADIGKNSYGIYLLHPVILEVCARSLQEFLPDVLAYQWLYLPLLMVPGVGIPLVLMRIIPRTPLRRHYKHLFG